MNYLNYKFENGNCLISESINLPEGKLHSHSFDEIAIVLAGTSIHIVGKEEYPLMRGDVFVIHGNQVHGNKKLSKFHVLNILS